ncbi:hypothetical protein D3P96_06880, partial [Weissella viridescens]
YEERFQKLDITQFFFLLFNRLLNEFTSELTSQMFAPNKFGDPTHLFISKRYSVFNDLLIV